ncbi:RdRP-domain-containing protein [Lentithecium fluviatile CBS 122367]|uniref:RNA-dependent RNA polymerase n=1 Tax=Lentithecium fluviatile CBS 122367 TaxID=1168545 RepID=A0A6G1JM69_9PLEO|nr:RdRP-domain-containing protein [Lentithecium fluviatile CBS 122367]
MRPTIRGAGKDWANDQESKVRVTAIPKGYWTKDVYEALGTFGTIVRIEMDPGRAAAWVTFQPPPNGAIYNQTIVMGSVRVRIELSHIRLYPVLSPVNPTKKYHEFNVLYANSIDFGVTVADKAVSVMQTLHACNDVRVTLSLRDRKELDFQFPCMIDGDSRKLRFRLPLSLVGVIYQVNDKETGQCTLIIPYETPPQFFMQIKANSISKTCNPNERTWIDWYTWYRQTDIVHRATRSRLETIPVMTHTDGAIIDIGRWTTYRVSFDPSTLESAKYEEFSNALADHGVILKGLEDFHFTKGTESPVWSLLEEEISGTHPHLTTQESACDELAPGQVHLQFPVRYQLEACLSNGYLKEGTITREFLERLASMDTDQAVHMLEKVTDSQHTYLDPMEIFSVTLKAHLTRKIPSHCVRLRAVNITPTMIHVSTPIVETSNRIIRKYATDADRFIRVKFSDEKTEGPIYSQHDDRSEALFDRVRRAMTNGIVVAGRYYEFLAFGNSQFREHGAYFYAPTDSKSADGIRASMGQFDHIKTAAKFGARLGQCFSTTRAIKSINVKIEMIPDVERNGFTFTDGVGCISPLLAKMTADEMGLPNAFENPPSLFQFRLGGCKGVLALDLKIPGSVVHIRPSQYKFEAQNVGLEIIRASALAVACFNRQLIIILSTLGVPDSNFIRKQQEMVNYFERATIDEAVALEKLQRNVDLNQTTLKMADMILDGFMEHKDPFMMSLLQLWRAYNIKYLKEKARIVIEQGAFVLGCVDETATLRGHFNDPQSREDATREEKLATLPEIFLRISDHTKKGHYKTIEKICVLARNPSLHAGDVRVVRAVDVPALHHLKNVVVLPQTGDRDIANMCSGGDLDGDDYIILWDSDFLPEIINEPPMDFASDKPVESEDPITVKDITNFFVTYMKNDSLRQIATAHLAQADFNEEGSRAEICLELARLHSQAVDYPKSGIPARMDRELRPRKWPHFQENRNRPSHKIYESKKILGMLYDQVELVDFRPQYENAFDSRILNAFQLDEAMIEAAKDIKSSYDSALKRLMAKHAIRTEFEAWSVFVLYHNLEARDYTFAEEFGRTIDVLKAQFVEDCCTAAGATGRSDFLHLAPFVAAMYTVTAREMEEALKHCRETKIIAGEVVPARKMDPEHMPLMSFPWLFHRELGKIATNSNFDHQSATVQQGLAQKHAKKHVDVGLTPEPGLGKIETTQGTTQYGELLKLDFSNSLGNNTLNTPSTTKTPLTEESDPRERLAAASAPSPPFSIYVGEGEESTIAKGPPPAVVTASKSVGLDEATTEDTLKRDAKQAAASSQIGGDSGIASTRRRSGPNSSGSDDTDDRKTDFVEYDGMKVDINLKKGSALDKLARFA